MTWSFSQALVEEFLQAGCSAGDAFAPLKSTGTDGLYYSAAKMTEHSSPSPSGTMFVHSMANRGEELLTSFRAAFPVKPFPRRLEVETLRRISGRNFSGSWQMSLLHSSGPRVLRVLSSKRQRTTLKRWVTQPDALPFQRQTWVLTTFGSDIGYVHTPTATWNYCKPSMQKWPGCRAFVRAFGEPSPSVHEWLMNWPAGWTDSKPLAREKFQWWLQQHGV